MIGARMCRMINEALELQKLEDTLREWSLRLIVLTDNHNVEVRSAVDWLFVFVETWRVEVQIERRFCGVSTTIEHLETKKAVLEKCALRITGELEKEKTAQSARLAELRICREAARRSPNGPQTSGTGCLVIFQA
jgi:hypothetical protein